MPRAKTPRAPKAKAEPKAENKILQMPENGNGHKSFTPADLESEIRLRAYELYAQRGYVDGYEQQDWLTAEREVLSRYAQQTHTA